jgi:hypothetical protein
LGDFFILKWYLNHINTCLIWKFSYISLNVSLIIMNSRLRTINVLKTNNRHVSKRCINLKFSAIGGLLPLYDSWFSLLHLTIEVVKHIKKQVSNFLFYSAFLFIFYYTKLYNFSLTRKCTRKEKLELHFCNIKLTKKREQVCWRKIKCNNAM